MKRTKIIIVTLFLLISLVTVSGLTYIDDTKAAPIIYEYAGNNSITSLSEESFIDRITNEDEISVIIKLNYEPLSLDEDRMHLLNNPSISIEDAQKIVEETRNKQFAYYTKKNNEFLKSLPKNMGIEDIVISNYSPFISLDYNSREDFIDNFGQLAKVARDSLVECINVYTSVEMENMATIGSTGVLPMTFNEAKNDINLSGTSTGSGIKIGMMELAGINKQNPNFTNVSVTNRTSSTDDHATLVASILGGNNGIASGASIYCTDANKVRSTFLSRMNWLLGYNVNLINICIGWRDSGKYTWYDAYLDYIVRFNFVTVVASAGNDGQTDAIVSSPATGYNVITVGATDGSKNVGYFSSYITSFNVRKPTLVAPGTKLNDIPNIPNPPGFPTGHSGTSFAAPMVTGCIARKMQQSPSTIMSPEIYISKLTSSASPLANVTSWDNESGAGLINFGQIGSMTTGMTPFIVSSNNVGNVVAERTFTSLKDRKIRASAVWLVNSTTSTIISGVNSNNVTDYRLVLLNSSGTVVATSNVANNIEFLEYRVTGGDALQSFKLQVIQVSAKKNSYSDIGCVSYSVMYL